VRHREDVDISIATTSGLESTAFEHPRFDRDNYVYIAVRNRGTQELRDAVAKVYWADPSSALAFPVIGTTPAFLLASHPLRPATR